MKGKRTIFGRLMEYLPRQLINSLVNKLHGDKWSKIVKTWDVLIALLNGHLTGQSTFRTMGLSHNSQIYLKNLDTKAIPRSTLADACKTKNPEIFSEICIYLVNQIQGCRKIKKEVGKLLHLIDSTPIPLDEKTHDWITGNCRIKGLKLHIEYDTDFQVPVFFSFSSPNVNDITEAKKIGLEEGVTYVFDKGYYDYEWWYEIHKKNSIFVTRLKKHTPHEVIKSFPVNTNSNIVDDQIIRLTTRNGKNFKGCLRKIRVKLFNKDTCIDIASNDIHSDADKIANLYKRRWEIEIFFRQIKQNLKIKKFWSRNENAIKLQILSGLIVYLLLRLIQIKTRCLHSIKQIGLIIRANLNSIVNLYRLFKSPGLISYLTKPGEAILC